MKTTIFLVILRGYFAIVSLTVARAQGQGSNHAKVAQLQKELLSDSSEGNRALSDQAYRAKRIEAIRSIIRTDILSLLNAGLDRPDEMMKALRTE